MLPEYQFDYSRARPNRFAGRVDESQVVVVLDPDVSEVFTTPESVNKVLRALISNMPAKGKSDTSSGASVGQ
jgi:hypothetical protein